jgi:hypothetical protein
MQNGKENEEKGISFGNGIAAIAGVLGGFLFAAGVPLVVLIYGQILGEFTIKIIVSGSVIGGGIIIIMSAFFGLVIPNHLQGNWQEHKHHTDLK